MKVMISRDERGRTLIKAVEGLSLQDLTDATDDQITTVTNLVWEIKGLFYALISGKASDVLADLDIGGGAKLSANLVADLTANMPRDVVISAQEQWLPNLATEMADRRGGWSTAVTEAGSPPPEKSGSDGSEAAPSSGRDAEVSETASIIKLDPPACTVRILGQCLLSKGRGDEAEGAKAEGAEAEAGEPEGAAGKTDTGNAKADGGEKTLSADEQLPTAEPKEASERSETAGAEGEAGENTISADEPPLKKAADQTDDLLFPTEDERRAIEAAEKAAQTKGVAGGAPADSDIAGAPPVISIESDVDPESWAEYGGWYRQDYAIYYRPTGHKDKFIYSWLTLTGPQAPKGDASPAAAVFDLLTGKDAQGACTKCHSVDDVQGKGRIVNFSPLSVESKRGSFTNFIHEPHFQAVSIGQRIGILENRGCLTCHELEKGPAYLKSYEQGSPQNFASNFGEVKKDLCQTCHNNSTARQDCLLCHKYHVNGVLTPIMSTKIPTQ
jgi:hypothetical protein